MSSRVLRKPGRFVYVAVVSRILKTKLHLLELSTSILRRGSFFKHTRAAVYIVKTFRSPSFLFSFSAFLSTKKTDDWCAQNKNFYSTFLQFFQYLIENNFDC